MKRKIKTMRELLTHLIVPGKPYGKKNRPQLFHSGIAPMNLLAVKDGKRKKIKDLPGYLWYVRSAVERGALTHAKELLSRGARNIRPIASPSKDYRDFQARALKVFRQRIDVAKPLVGRDHWLLVNCKFFLAPRQRPDLDGLLAAVADVLESGGLIKNDYRIAGWGKSRRIFPPTGSTVNAKAARRRWRARTEIWVYDLGIERPNEGQPATETMNLFPD